MRKKMLCYSVLGLFITSGIISCKKEQTKGSVNHERSKSSLMSAKAGVSIEEKRVYLENALKDVAKYVVTEAKSNKNAKQTIYKELEKNIDGDDNALVDIFSADVPALYSNAAFKTALSVFGDLDGDKYFPQVFIPAYGTLKSNNKINNTNEITCVFYTGDETQDAVMSYTLDDRGIWHEASKVTEDFTNNHEVWVFSLNETFTNVIDRSIVPRDTIIQENRSYSDGHSAAKPTGFPCDNGTHYWPYIQNMTIRKNNESWLAGKSDISIKTYTGWNTPNSVNPCDNSKPQIMWTNNANGEIFVAKFMRYFIPNTGKAVNCGYAGSWCPGTVNVGGWQGDAFNYVIFEKDAWPVGDKSTTINNNGYTATFVYKSSDPFYDKGIILFWGAPGTHMNGYTRDVQGQIKFNSRL